MTFNIPTGHSIMAAGLHAFYRIMDANNCIAIGPGAGSEFQRGERVILIGKDVQAPAPEYSDYINICDVLVIDGKSPVFDALSAALRETCGAAFKVKMPA